MATGPLEKIRMGDSFKKYDHHILEPCNYFVCASLKLGLPPIQLKNGS